MSRLSSALDGRPRATALVAIGGALVLWVAITWTAAASVGESPWANGTWIRWDSEHYLSIAEQGYEVGPCVDVPFREAGDLCGNAGWYPGYPYLVRALAFIGPSGPVAGRVVATAGLVALFASMWFGFLARRPRHQGLAAMALVAAFPSSVYFGAVFPIGLLAASMTGCLVLIDRRRWVGAGLLGAAAAVLYPSGVVVGVVAVLALSRRGFGSRRERFVAATWLGLSPLLAFAAVHAELWRTTGRLDAWFRVQAAYDIEASSPVEVIRHQLDHLGHGSLSWIGIQTVFVLLLVGITITVAWADRRDLRLGERAAVVLVAAMWLVPLSLGVSLWRADAILVTSVILLSRLSTRSLVALTLVAVPLSFNMARLFFDHTLI